MVDFRLPIIGQRVESKGQGRKPENRLSGFPALASLSLLPCVLYFFVAVAVAQPTQQTLDADDQAPVWTPVLQYSADPEVQSYVALCKAVYWKHMKEKEEVKRQLEAAIQFDRHSSFLYAKLAEVLYDLEDIEGAELACKTSLELNPGNADAHYLLGVFYLKPQDRRSRQIAINEFRTAAKLNPEHLPAQHRLAALLFYEKDYRGAADAYSAMVKLKPYDPMLRNRLGISYFKSGESAKAIKEFNAAMRIRKDYLDPHFHLAYVYASQSKNKEAIEECMIVLRAAPGEPDMNLLLAEIYVSMAEFDKAIPIAKRILGQRGMKKNRIAEAYYRLATAYKGNGEAQLADPNFQKAISIYNELLMDRRNVGIHYDIAMVYDAKGDLALAERHLRRHIRLKPDEPNAYNFLGYAFIQHDVDLEEAVALIKKAVAMQPQNGAFHDSLGWAYFKLGNLDEAIAELEKAAEFIPDDSDIREHLGEVYLKKGRSDPMGRPYIEKAVLEWEKALEMKPKNVSLQQKLENLRRSLE